MRRRPRQLMLVCLSAIIGGQVVLARPTRKTETYRRFKAHLDAVPAIDTHNHLLPFEQLRQLTPTEYGPGMNLAAIWQGSYYSWINPLAMYKPAMPASRDPIPCCWWT